VSGPLSPPFIADLPLTCEALEYAIARHEGQRRDSDAAPFILHPLEVAVLLRNRGYEDEIVAAGLLHDAVEDTDATPEEIGARFGDRVGGLVDALSDDESIEDYRERKAALRAQVEAAGPEAAAIYAADKIAKARELRAELTREPGTLDEPGVQRRLDHYEASLAMLERALPDNALPRQLRFELWALRTLPPEA
jgi:(p)ppGpp synthase/HD superfamily hydrolase